MQQFEAFGASMTGGDLHGDGVTIRPAAAADADTIGRLLAYGLGFGEAHEFWRELGYRDSGLRFVTYLDER